MYDFVDIVNQRPIVIFSFEVDTLTFMAIMNYFYNTKSR